MGQWLSNLEHHNQFNNNIHDVLVYHLLNRYQDADLPSWWDLSTIYGHCPIPSWQYQAETPRLGRLSNDRPGDEARSPSCWSVPVARTPGSRPTRCKAPASYAVTLWLIVSTSSSSTCTQLSHSNYNTKQTIVRKEIEEILYYCDFSWYN